MSSQQTEKKPSEELLQVFFTALKNNDYHAIRDAVTKGVPADFRFQATFDNTKYEDINSVVLFVFANKPEGIKLMAELGCPVHSDGLNYDPLISAANRGFEECVKVLIDLGADPYRPFNDKGENAISVMRERKQTQGIRLIQKYYLGAFDQSMTEQTGDLVVTQPFGERCLQDIFNFKAQQRTRLIRQKHDGVVEAATEVSFKDLEPAYLRDMAELFVSRGGKIDEALYQKLKFGKGAGTTIKLVAGDFPKATPTP